MNQWVEILNLRDRDIEILSTTFHWHIQKYIFSRFLIFDKIYFYSDTRVFRTTTTICKYQDRDRPSISANLYKAHLRIKMQDSMSFPAAYKLHSLRKSTENSPPWPVASYLLLLGFPWSTSRIRPEYYFLVRKNTIFSHKYPLKHRYFYSKVILIISVIRNESHRQTAVLLLGIYFTVYT